MLAKLGSRVACAVPVSTVAIAASAVFGLMTLRADPAMGQVSCGQTIKTDTKLHRDLTDCPSNGIVIGADGISLDLNGHRITGDGKLYKDCRRDEVCDVGIADHGHDDVKVTNGSVRGFAIGVTVAEARRVRVVGISSSSNLFFGILVRGSRRTLVSESSASKNLKPEGDGMGVFDSDHVRIVNSSFRGNAQLGLHVEASHHNLIQGNVIARNADFGIVIGGDRNEVRRNRCAGNGVACTIVERGTKNVIARNRIRGGGDGIGIENARGNLVARNVLENVGKTGIYLGLDDPPIGGGNNQVRRNVVIASGKDAFLVHGPDRASVLAFNVAKRAGDDGFDVESRSSTLRDNRAVRNADLGIEGVRGMGDGGGNVARRNGDPRQCTHISC